MPLFTSLDEIPKTQKPCGLTIGTFDGVHLGHQHLLKHLRAKIPAGGLLTALTFSNHPSVLFSSKNPVPLIYPPLQKVKHLFEVGVDRVVLVPFDQELSSIPYDIFLLKLKRQLGFKWLTLGEGATFGKGKQGNAAAVQEAGNTLDFEVEYLRKTSLHHHCISSGRIRLLIQQGDLTQAAECLGRRYSLMGYPVEHQGQLFCPFPGLCLPPDGEYEVEINRSENETTLFTRGVVSVSKQKQGLYIKCKEMKHTLNYNIEIIF